MGISDPRAKPAESGKSMFKKLKVRVEDVPPPPSLLLFLQLDGCGCTDSSPHVVSCVPE